MRHHRWTAVLVTCALATITTACGKAQPTPRESSPARAVTSALHLPTMTPAGTKAVKSITWATYTPVTTIDPIQAYDYPPNTAVSLMCESVLAQRPDGAIAAGLTSATQPDSTTIVLSVNPKAHFWDGHPVTAADVAFSLNRNLDPSLGGLYGSVFDRVSSITAVGSRQVRISLKQPDYWLEGELSSMPGVVVEKAFAQKAGKAFGTPSGGTMCTGAYRLSHWQAGGNLTVTADDSYWRGTKPLVRQITLQGVPEESSLTSALLTGAIDGYYSPGPYSTTNTLTRSSKVSVYRGPSFATDMMAISATKGPLASVKVRQAISTALDRQAYIASSYQGNALLPRTLANPGTWGYARGVFEADWNRLPQPTMNVAAGKRLVKQAGYAGQTITIGTSQEIPSIAPAVATFQNAAEAVGLKVKLDSVSASQFVAFFSDPKAFRSVDGFPTINYPDYADPAGLYKTLALPGGSQNFSGYSNPTVTRLLDRARITADPVARARLVAHAGDIIATDLPWIPLAVPETVLFLNRTLSGAPSSFSYMAAQWAGTLGGRG